MVFRVSTLISSEFFSVHLLLLLSLRSKLSSPSSLGLGLSHYISPRVRFVCLCSVPFFSRLSFLLCTYALSVYCSVGVTSKSSFSISFIHLSFVLKRSTDALVWFVVLVYQMSSGGVTTAAAPLLAVPPNASFEQRRKAKTASIANALTAALVHENQSNVGGIPIPPLIRLISEYATPCERMCRLLPLSNSSPTLIAICALVLLLVAWVYTLGGDGVSRLLNGRGIASSFSFPTALIESTKPVPPPVSSVAAPVMNAVAASVAAAAEGSASAASGVGATVIGTGDPDAPPLITSARALLIADAGSHCIRQLSVPDCVSCVFAGTGETSFSSIRPVSSRQTAKFLNPSALCVVPGQPAGSYLIAEIGSVRFVNGNTGEVTLIAGSSQTGYADGTGEAAKFKDISGLVMIRSGEVCYCADSDNHRIRVITLHGAESGTGTVTTVCGDGAMRHSDGVGTTTGCSIYSPSRMVWDPTTRVPDSVLYITAFSSIRRFDVATAQLTTVKLNGKGKGNGKDDGGAAAFGNLFGLAVTSTGVLVATCVETHSLYAIDPVSGDWMVLAGAGLQGAKDGPPKDAQFKGPADVLLLESECAVIVSDRRNHRIRYIQLDEWIHVPNTSSSSAAPAAAAAASPKSSGCVIA